MRKGSGSVEIGWDDESEQTHALEFKTLAPWYVPELHEGEFDGARELSWEATLNELVEATDVPRMYESHSRPISRSAGALAGPEESSRSETRRTRTLGVADRPATPLREAANDLGEPPPSAAASEPARNSVYDSSELRAPRWLWLFAAAMTVLVIGLTLRLWLLTMSEVSVDEPTVHSMSSNFMLPRRAQTGFVIDTRPSGAEVHVDGSSTGLITPARVQHLAAGVHAINLRLRGYADTELRAVLEDGVTANLPDVVLRPPAALAQPVEPAPVEPASAEHTSAEHASAEPQAATPRPLRRAKVRTASASPSGTGVLQINSRPWARVFVDGHFAGDTPQRSLRLQAGSHAIRLVNDELHMSRSFKLMVRSGETTAKLVELQ